MVQETGDRGKGLIASKSFRMGDLIFKERAVFTIMSRGREAGPDILTQVSCH